MAVETEKKSKRTSQAEIVHLNGQVELRQVPCQRLTATFAKTSADKENRRIDMTWYTGASVRRYGWGGPFYLSFSMDPAHIRMSRLESGNAPLLDSHNDWRLSDVIGVIEKAWLEGGQGKASVRFSSRDEVTPIWTDVEDGILRNASMGVSIHKLKETTKEGDQFKSYLAVDWEPEEVSVVAIGADPGAGFRGSGGEEFFEIESLRATSPEKEKAVEQETITKPGEEARTEVNLDAERQAATLAERTRVLDVNKVGQQLGLDAAFIALHVEKGTSIDEFRKLGIDEKEKRDPKVPATGTNGGVTRDEGETRRAGMAASLLFRFDPTKYPLKDDLGRDFVGLTLLDLARECLEAKGKATRRMHRNEIAALALSTSDFPNILADVANKTLRGAYDAYPQTFRPFSRQRSASDFKNINAMQLGEAPQLLKVNEKGEFTHGSIAEGKETYKLLTYGRIVSLTRQTIINDDLSAFTRIPAGFGVAAATLESDTVWGIITTNGNMADNVALFHANHSNLNANSALALDKLGAAMANMAKQKGLDGLTTLNIQGRYVAVPVALQLTIFQLIAANLAPAVSANLVPEYLRALMPVAEPRLDANSTTTWYMFASPDQIDTIEYAYLEGNEGVYLETRQGYDVDGVEIKARLDFGAKAIDWRGMAKNTA